MSFLSSRHMALFLVVLLQALCNLSSVSAQLYLNNHQQFMRTYDWERIIGQAIDNADGGQYGITGIIQPNFLDLVQRPFLAKLGKNKPISNPFDIQWAVTYLTPDEPQEPSYLDFNVRDVIYTRQGGYVIAGQVRRLDASGVGARYYGFLLHTDGSGSPLFDMKVYDQLEILTSVAQNPEADVFGAVGASYASDDKRGQPAILSVQYDLSPICYTEIYGDFNDTVLYPSQWGVLNKVIPYTSSNIEFSTFLSVGQVTGFNSQFRDYIDTDLLFTTFDEKCNINVNKRYGQPRTVTTDGSVILNTEVGNSITVQGERALIAGFVSNCYVLPSSSCGNKEDILYMAIKIANGSLSLSFRYDIYYERDIGMAIEWRQGTESVLIAGETYTKQVLGDDGWSDDIFLLELEVKGQLKKLELFGTSMTDEFHVDLTLSKDKNAVMLSNSPLICDVDGPWLIERYDNIQQQCRDAPHETARESYKVATNDVRSDQMDIDDEKVELVAKKFMLEQWIWCPKVKL